MKFVLIALATFVCCSSVSAQTPFRDGFITTRDSVKLYYQVYGSHGDTIIHLHGGPGGSLTAQMPNLLKLSEKHVLVFYDQRGGGRSVPVDTLRIDVKAHIRDLEDLRRELGIPRMTLYGHSWGAAVAVMYAAEHRSRAHQLVLNGPMPPARTPYNEQRQASVAAAITRLCEQRATAAGQPIGVYVEQCRAAPRITSRVYYHDTLNIARRQRATPGGDAITPDGWIANRRTLAALGDWDFRPLLKRVNARALVVEGEHTPIPLDQVRLWAATMPNARLLLVPRTGHAYPHIENAEFFFPALETFLRGEWPLQSQ